MVGEIEPVTAEPATPLPWQAPALEQLVDREEQVGQFKERLRRIRQNRPLSPSLYEWYGGPGIGKTMLIRLLVDVCRRQECRYAAINFKELNDRAFLADPSRLIESMAEQLIGHAALKGDLLHRRARALRQSEHPDDIVTAYAKLSRHDLLYARPEWLDKMRSVATSFIGLVRNLGLEQTAAEDPVPHPDEQERFTQPVALFFDETDYAPANLIYWLEEWVISPLLASRHCVIVWTARSPWRWRKPDVQNLVNLQSLAPFSLEESTAQLRRGGELDLATELFGRIFALTHGHPAANRVAQEQLAEKWPDLPEPRSLSAQDEQDLLRAVFERVINQYAFKNLSDEEAAAFRRVALVRWFDVTMLQALLSWPEDHEFQGWGTADFRQLLNQMKLKQLLAWDKGLTLDPALRPIIHDYYRLCEPDIYIRANRVALDVYGQWLDRAIDNRNLYLIEELYHWALLEQVGQSVMVDDEPMSVAEHLRRRLAQYRDWIPDPDNRRHVLGLLQGQISADKDLARLTVNESLSELVEPFLLPDETPEQDGPLAAAAEE